MSDTKGWSISFRSDKRQFELHCPHGIGHPENMGKHGCDGCCKHLTLEMTQDLKDEYQNPNKVQTS